MTGNVRITKGMICECGNLKEHKRAIGCARCQWLDDQRVNTDRPAARVARVLSLGDWSNINDLVDALEVPPGKNPERWALTAALGRMADRGEVEQRYTAKHGWEYRLLATPKVEPMPASVFVEHLLHEQRPAKTKSEIRRNIRARRLARGQCRECSQPHLPGIQLCAQHKEDEAKRKHECAQRRKAA